MEDSKWYIFSKHTHKPGERYKVDIAAGINYAQECPSQDVGTVWSEFADEICNSHNALIEKKFPLTPEEEKLGAWMSAALDDPKACKEFKDTIRAWFEARFPS